jgi:hypothetical protein
MSHLDELDLPLRHQAPDVPITNPEKLRCRFDVDDAADPNAELFELAPAADRVIVESPRVQPKTPHSERLTGVCPPQGTDVRNPLLTQRADRSPAEAANLARIRRGDTSSFLVTH